MSWKPLIFVSLPCSIFNRSLSIYLSLVASPGWTSNTLYSHMSSYILYYVISKGHDRQFSDFVKNIQDLLSKNNLADLPISTCFQPAPRRLTQESCWRDGASPERHDDLDACLQVWHGEPDGRAPLRVDLDGGHHNIRLVAEQRVHQAIPPLAVLAVGGGEATGGRTEREAEGGERGG